MEFWIPYGETEVPIRVPDDNFYKILEPGKPGKAKDPVSLVSESLDRPINGSSISEMVKPGVTAGIIVDPLVPPTLRDVAVEQLRTRLEKAGVTATKVFLRRRISNVAFPHSPQEGTRILDPASGTFNQIGQTGSGTKVFVDQELLSCEVKICVALTMPHFASGFAGGPEAILPGASSMETITKNRSLLVQGIVSPADQGDSAILQDSLEACRLAGPFYSLCFVPDGWGGADTVFSGELEAVFKEARTRYLEVHCTRIDRRADVVVVSAGNVLGMDLYHSVRVLSNAWKAVKKDGTMVLVAECSKGVGDSNFLDYSRRFQERRELLAELRHRFRLGGHVSLLLQEALERYRVQLVSVLPDYYVRNSFRLKPSRTASHAVQQAIRAEGKDAKILIITRGDLTLPVINEQS